MRYLQKIAADYFPFVIRGEYLVYSKINKLDVVNSGEQEQVRPSHEQRANEKWHADIVSRLQQQHDDFELEQDEQPKEGTFFCSFLCKVYMTVS